jgi:hypothetical protein
MCLGLHIDHHQSKKYAFIKRQVKMQYTKHHHVLCESRSFTTFLFCNEIVRLYVVGSSLTVVVGM